MKHNFVLKKFTLTPNEEKQMEKRLERLNKFFGDETEATIKLSTEGNKEKIEITNIWHTKIAYFSGQYLQEFG